MALFTDGGSRLPCYSSFASGTHLLFMVTYYHDYMEVYVFHMARKSRDFEPFMKPNSSPARALKG